MQSTKKIAGLAALVLLAGVVQAPAAGLITKALPEKDALNAVSSGTSACHFISKATAEKKALAAVGGGKVLSIRLETNDNPPIWSVDVQTPNGSEYEVQVNACTGKIVAIIPGG